MVPARYSRERGLTSRVVLTMVLLAVLYGLLVTPFFQVSTLWGLAAVAAVAVLLTAQFRYADNVALWAMDAREVSAAEEPELHGLVERLCMSSGLPKPRVAVADTEIPNAFAAGCRRDRAVVCVTTGLRERLDVAELESVLAHEMAHLAHRDVVVATIAGFPAFCGGLIITTVSGLLLGEGRLAARLAGVVLLPMVALAVLLFPLSQLLNLAISRQRELCADRTGALLTGRPAASSAALTKICAEIESAPTAELRELRPLNGLLTVPARATGRAVADLVSTHPPVEVRVRRLTEVSQRLASGRR
ncbi:M48 family metalloprotease [Actinomadura rudentiformis]|uniref:M48 family metalloprotease n=1 Tax=Actinomadura rudentiformis TaxID=359158 RepID=A0A6H9YBZ8_9ACTN|nr:M48 family metalloprotease [Actinomadura rudentiformis]KAB2342916.1 M48 family metalloprotease [Actinomadura rudentiformis]